jgi:drug/metabolite transporter (DMT)-like permease
MDTVTRGLIAGAAGTAALNIVTYLDMVVRGRPASSAPEDSVQRLADLAGVDLGEGKAAEHRRAGLGPLLGYATGLGAAICYGFLVRRRLPRPVAAGVLTALAMSGSNVPMALLGISDPRRWSAADWAADLVPHLAYGAVAATVDDRLR